MIRPGQAVDRYVVEGLVGEGGMAVVFKVRHRVLGSLHALKLLQTPSPTIAARLLAEGRAQAQVRHPNLVPVTDVVEVAGMPGLIMDFVDGPSLEDWAGADLPAETLDALAAGLMDGLEAAHARGLVHRDLKPANVLLDGTTGRLVPRITDFGIAKALDGSGGAGTRTGLVMGTPRYMAPEQLRDASRVDGRADLFSLGCVLYELATGRTPFDGVDLVTLIQAIGEGTYDPSEEARPDLPLRIHLALDGALESDPELRLPDVAALREEWFEGGPVGGVLPEADARPTARGLHTPGTSSETWGPAEADAPSGTAVPEDTTPPPPAPAAAATPEPAPPEAAPPAPASPAAEPPAPAPPPPEPQAASPAPEPPAAAASPQAAPRRAGLAALGLIGAGLVGGLFAVQQGVFRDPESPPAAREAAPSTGATLPAPTRAPAEPTAAPAPAEPTATPTAAPDEPVAAAAAASSPAPAPAPVVAPAPAPAPADAAPPPREETAPDPEPEAPEPAPPPEAPTSGTFTVEGGVRVLLKDAAGGSHRPGTLPAGTYTVFAFFDGMTPQKVGTLDLAAGQSRTIKCMRTAQECRF